MLRHSGPLLEDRVCLPYARHQPVRVGKRSFIEGEKKEDESESDEACCPSCVRWGFVRLLLARLAVSVSVSLSLFTFINVGSLWSRATSVSVSLSLFTFVLLSLSLSRCPCSHESVRLLKPDRAHLRYLRTGKMSTWTRNMCEHNKARTRIRTRTTRLQGRARQDTHDTSSRQLCTGFCAARTFEGDSAA